MAFMACLFAVPAQENRFSVTPLLTYQHLYVEDETLDYSSLGLGAELSLEHMINNTDFLGLTVSYERYSFKDFYSFHDFKAALTSRYLLIPYGKNESPVRLYRTLGAGADYVMREDGKNTLYFLMNAGLQLAIRQTEKTEFRAKADIGVTTKGTANALNASFGVLYSISLGGSSSKQKTEEKSHMEKTIVVPPVIEEIKQIEPVEQTEQIEPTEHVHSLITGYSILESTETKRGYRCYICSECGLICEIMEPGK